MSFTTVPVKPDTLKRLRAYKTNGKSFDDVLNEMMEEHPPESFIREHLRRLHEEERVNWETVKRKYKL